MTPITQMSADQSQARSGIGDPFPNLVAYNHRNFGCATYSV